MKKTRFMFLVCLVSSFLMASYAVAGPYVSGQVGATWVDDADFNAGGDTGESSFDTGFNVGVSGGYDFGPVRAEGEVTYRLNDVDEYNVTGFGTFTGDGDVSALSLLANGFWDIEIPGPVTPYLGAGIGVAQVSLDDSTPGIDDDDTVFAYQVAAGAAFELMPSLALDLGYRYFATADPEFEDAAGTFESEYKSHNLSLGVRFQF